MSTYKLATATILLSLIATLFFLGCEMAEQEPSRNNDEIEKGNKTIGEPPLTSYDTSRYIGARQYFGR